MYLLLILGAGLTAAVLLKIRHLFLYSVKIYNYRGQSSYVQMGRAQLVRKRGIWRLQIPEDIIRRSLTTAYRLKLSRGMAERGEGSRMLVCFGNGYVRMESMKGEMYTKNHIATSTLL